MSHCFDHENLRAYQASLEFISWLHDILKRVPKTIAVYNHLDRASTSISLNIAEGNGKYSKKDRCNYFDIARGSAFECASGLDVLVAQSLLSETDIVHGKEILKGIVSMLVGLIKSNSPDRLYDKSSLYES
jgi:four helix bundle protein